MTSDRFGAFLAGVEAPARRALEELRRRITETGELIAGVVESLAGYLPLTGGDISGALTVQGDPVTGTGSWQTLTLAIGAQTIVRTPQWRRNGGRIELRGEFTRTAAMAAGTTIANFGGGNPPAPATNIPGWGVGTIVASTPDNQPVALQAHSSLGLRTTTTTFALANGDGLALDTMWWPA